MIRMHRLAFVAALLGLTFAALPAFAQLDYGSGALMIAMTPAYPSPNATVHLTAQSPILDLSHSSIAWSVNGAPAGSGLSIDVPAGAAGSHTAVSVSVSGASGSGSAQIDLTPAPIDLLWEADSYTPPFYEGRALPTSGSKIRVLAIPHVTHADGSPVPASALDFTWKVNGAILLAQSGIGANFITIPAAILYGSDTIIVDVRAADGSQGGEASAVVRTGNPQLLLYINSPLFGIMYHRALGESGNAGDSEIAFTAIPYFINSASPRSAALAYTWSIDGTGATTDPNDPNEFTVRARAPGSAQIGLSVAKPNDPFVSADGSWTVSFGGSGANGGTNDVFHAGTR